VLLQEQPADVREEESAFGVVGIRVSLYMDKFDHSIKTLH
jgi:hypothetical protein